jgi:hypothetical protein
MPYFLLIVGLILIYVSLKGRFMNKPEITTFPQSATFDNLVKEELKSKEIKKLEESLNELRFRVDNIEHSLFILEKDKKDQEETEILNSENNMDINTVNIESNEIILGIQDVNSKIYDLFDSGTDIETICSILGLGKGEVLLRLGLRRQQK